MMLGGITLGEKLLTAECKFKCICGVPLVAGPPLGMIARDQGQPFLTEDTKLRPGTFGLECPIQMAQAAGAAPIPCAPSLAGGWKNLADGIFYTDPVSQRKRRLLKEGSTASCAHGGLILVEKHTVHSITSLNSCAAPLETQVEPCSGAPSSSADQVSVQEDAYQPDTPQPDVSWPDALQPDISWPDALQPDAVSQSDAPKAPDLDNEKAQQAWAECMYAKGCADCPEADDCEFFWARIHKDIVNNSSIELRKNYKEDSRTKHLYINYAEYPVPPGEEPLPITTAMHHLIPGNQVILSREKDENKNERFQCGTLAKIICYLAQREGTSSYQINGAPNGLPLPTYRNANDSNEDNDIGPDGSEYAAQAWDIMRRTKAQLHAGGHSYKIGKSLDAVLDEYRRKTGGDKFADYMTAVIDRLDTLSLRYRRHICWKHASERVIRNFIDDMNRVSEEIERSLRAFGTDPRSSYPFFVSIKALEYAFQEESFKLIVIYRNGQGELLANRVLMKRRRDQISFQEERDRKTGEWTLRIEFSDLRQLARFCRNRIYFLIDGNAGYTLPFPQAEICPIALRDENVTAFLEQNRKSIYHYVKKHPIS